jgi:hypothetical protein
MLILSFSQLVIFFWIWVKSLYNKQNNTWTLGDINLFSCVQVRYITCSLCSLMRYQAWTLEDKFNISARPCIIFYLLHRPCSIYLYPSFFYVSYIEAAPFNSLSTSSIVIQKSHYYLHVPYYFCYKALDPKLCCHELNSLRQVRYKMLEVLYELNNL